MCLVCVVGSRGWWESAQQIWEGGWKKRIMLVPDFPLSWSGCSAKVFWKLNKNWKKWYQNLPVPMCIKCIPHIYELETERCGKKMGIGFLFIPCSSDFSKQWEGWSATQALQKMPLISLLAAQKVHVLFKVIVSKIRDPESMFIIKFLFYKSLLQTHWI